MEIQSATESALYISHSIPDLQLLSTTQAALPIHIALSADHE